MTNNLHPNELLLLQQIADGDTLAFRQIYDQYRQKIYSFAVQLTKSEDEADEIVQEVFMRLWNKRSSLEQVQHFNAWIHQVARNIFLDALRKIIKEEGVKKELAYLAAESAEPVQDRLADKELTVLLQQAIQQLSPQQRTIFELSRLHGLKRAEIASQLGLSENTVRVHLTRALNSIREYLATAKGSALLVFILIFLYREN